MKGLTTTFAKWLFSIPMLISGVFHFMNGNAMVGAVPVPGGVFWVYFTGAALIAAAIAIVSGKLAKLAALLLAVLLLTFALTVHLPSVLAGNTASMVNLLKDISLAGGALVISGISKN